MIEIKDEQLKKLMAEAIFAALGEKSREMLVQEAITSLVTDKNDSGYRKTPLIQDLFDRQLRDSASAMIREILEHDEGFKAKVKDLTREPLKSLSCENMERSCLSSPTPLRPYLPRPAINVPQSRANALRLRLR